MYREKLLNQPHGLRERDDTLAAFQRRGLAANEELTRLHEDLKDSVEAATNRIEEMEATREDNANIQVRKNARLYEFAGVSTDAAEPGCLPDAFWEAFDQCKWADTEVRHREHDLSEHDERQQKASQDAEKYAKRGIRSVLARLSSDVDDEYS